VIAAMPTTIFLARHGQSEWNNQALITGQTDIGLSDKGRLQADAMAHCLQGEALDVIVVSALRRTADTAEPTARAKGLTMTRLAALNEIHLGVLQGRRRDETDTEAQALWAAWQADLWGFRVPGGERFDEFADRVGAALDDILARHAGQRVLIVGHRATNRVLMGRLLGWPRERWQIIAPRNKYFYRLVLASTGEPQVDSYALSGSKTGQLLPGWVP
jgi:broad specificity phosphatase PhoE